jgi:hypothetical protein
MIILRLFVPTLFMVIGILLLLKGYEHGYKSYERERGSASASGEIVKIVPYLSKKPGKSSAIQYFPDVKYTTAEGKEATFRSQVTSRADHYKPGDKVRVLYKDDNPQDAVIGSFSALWALALIFGSGGLLVMLFASWFFRQAFVGYDKKT